MRYTVEFDAWEFTALCTAVDNMVDELQLHYDSSDNVDDLIAALLNVVTTLNQAEPESK